MLLSRYTASSTLGKGRPMRRPACRGPTTSHAIFPPLGHDAMLQQTDPTGLEHVILAGSRIGPTTQRPFPLAMRFAWKLTDGEIADVGTYIRNSWGNHAPRYRPAPRHKLNLSTTNLA
jgi:mono/diheme cytochrome c family protein